MTAYKPLQLSSIIKPGEMRSYDFALLRRLEEWDRNMGAVLNRGIMFSENVDAVSVTFTTSATPDEENTVPHTLGKVPTGFLVYSIDRAAIIYNGSVAWDKTNIYLKSNVAVTTFKAWIF